MSIAARFNPGRPGVVFPPFALQLVAEGDAELIDDLMVLVTGLAVSAAGGILRAGARSAPLSDRDRRARLCILHTLWRSGAALIVDEGLLRDVIRRRPQESRIIAFELLKRRAATAAEIEVLRVSSEWADALSILNRSDSQ
ncbi:MAG: hypothetical protein KDJ16_08760 [Hyphomicrobiales bacterium]|nr:hypothetical protein [Hyphomicrobiales bacterium]